MFLKLRARLFKREDVIKKWLEKLADDIYLELASNFDLISVTSAYKLGLASFAIYYFYRGKKQECIKAEMPFGILVKTAWPALKICSMFLHKHNRHIFD